MDGSIRQILDPRILTASYAQVANDLPTPLTSFWFDGVPKENIDDDSFRSMYDPADTTPAPGNFVGSEARIITVGIAKEKIFNMVYSFNKTNFKEDVIRALREPDSHSLQKMGRTEIVRVMTKFRNRQKRFKELYIAKWLTQGVIYMNQGGFILESSSGQVTTADFEVPAGNKGNLGGLITGLFSVASTDIPSILEAIDDQATANNVPIPTDVWVNKLNLQYLRNNNAFKFWAQYNQQAADSVLNGGIIPGLWGKNWHFVGTQYTNSSGSMTPYIPKTGQGSLVLTPPAGGAWMKATIGLSLLPKNLNIVTDVEQALADIEEVYGEFAYAQLKADPIGLVGYLGDKFGLNYNDPGAIWMGTGF